MVYIAMGDNDTVCQSTAKKVQNNGKPAILWSANPSKRVWHRMASFYGCLKLCVTSKPKDCRKHPNDF